MISSLTLGLWISSSALPVPFKIIKSFKYQAHQIYVDESHRVDINLEIVKIMVLSSKILNKQGQGNQWRTAGVTFKG